MSEHPEYPIAYWTTDAPLSPEHVDEDMALLKQFVIPDGIVVHSAEVYVNGRLWKRERLAAPFGDIRREWSNV